MYIRDIKILRYGKNLLKKPVAIISRYESATPIVVALIYNLIFGGIIGIVGSLYADIDTKFCIK